MKSPALTPRLSLLAAAIGLSTPAFSQTSTTTLPDVVVTATRLESRADTVVNDVTVIDAADLDNLSGHTLTEIISRFAGIQTVANGGRGSASSLIIRGTESRHVLLLIDGVRMGSATLGAASFDNIALESIERIEIVKGPGSALYGSDAIGGVVQIFTKKGTKDLAARASITVGSLGHRAASAGVTGTAGTARFAVGGAHVRETGFSATNAKVPFDSFNPDNDGFRQTSAYASLGLDLNANWQLDARLTASEGKSLWDSGAGTFSPTSDLNNQSLSLSLKGKISADWTTHLRLGQTEDKSTFNTEYGTDNFDTQNRLVSWTNEIKTPLGTVLAGLEQQKDGVASNTAFDVSQRSINAAFIGLTGQSGAHAWQFNLRRDSNSQFGDATTGFAGYSYRINPQWRVQGAYGTSFKAPSFNQLYYPLYGNATTQPEKGRNTEFGVTYTRGAHEVKLTRFDNKIQGFITDVPTVTNIPQARIQGWTLAYQSELGATRIKAALDLLDPKNVLTANKLARRADQQLTLGVDTTIGSWSLGGDLVSVSKRFDDAANTIALAPFVTADLYANYRLSKDWVLQAKVNNLTDKVYETALGYNQPGRTVFLTVRFQPK